MLQLSEKELERLPPLFRHIVLNQRRIESIVCDSVVSFEAFKAERNTRIGYRRDADNIYRPLANKGGPATSPA